MSKHHFTGYKRHDWIIASALAVIFLFLCTINLTSGASRWGDDYAAYISEGIAIVEGTLEEQAILNYDLHPSPLPDEASPDGLVYVWGFPLLLSLVYRVVGFDRVDFSSVIYYKLPTVICMALLCSVLYLFYRRRFSAFVSAAASFILCAYNDFFLTLNKIYSDLVFLFFSMLVILLIDCFLWNKDEASGSVFRPSVFKGLCLGAAMWFTYEVRLNGSTLIVVFLIAHAVYILQHRSSFSLRTIPRHLLPYAVTAALVLLSGFILPSATSNLSDVGNADFQTLLSNFTYYIRLTGGFFYNLCDRSVLLLVPVAFLLVIGFFFEGFKVRNLHLTILMVGTYIILLLLPYTQSTRYMYNILPILVLWPLHGIDRVKNLVTERISGKRLRVTRFAIIFSCAVFTLWTFTSVTITGIRNIQSDRYEDIVLGNPYTVEAIDMYRFIQEETPEDCTICFVKPRALYLNTGRMSVLPGMNGHQITDGDYALYVRSIESNAYYMDPPDERMTLLHENRYFTFYEINAE